MSHYFGSGLGVDKRKASILGADPHTHTTGETIFTANAVGTTTTLVGANAAPGTDDTNVVRRDEKFRLYDSGGDVKEETVFLITDVAVAASTTVTFEPAAAVATASGDEARLVGNQDYMDEDTLDRRLQVVDPSYYTDARLTQMTQNDKTFAIRSAVDPGGI